MWFWFHVIWMLMAQKTGMSAENFHRTFGFGRYQTSWDWLQKMGSVMEEGYANIQRSRLPRCRR